MSLPGAHQPTATWRAQLPENVGFTEARATSDGVRITVVGHLVNLGSAR
ncbi:hypothetical protein ACWCPX_40220 [Streptomyces olivaceoviridis]